MAHLAFHHVTVRYAVYNSRSQSFRNQLVKFGTGGRLANEAGRTVSVTALDDVCFTLQHGDRLGLIGHNGAGKTTMLRTMAGVYAPIAGRVVREGTLATIIELGAGMDAELSGYENILRMGMLLGKSLRDMQRATPSIAAFTELGDFLGMPMRTYSSGMTMRLMFAVATSSQPEILLVDEMFGTGDQSFQTRAERRMHDLMEAASIVVFASHSHDLIRKFCNRVFRLDHGKIEEVSLGRMSGAA